MFHRKPYNVLQTPDPDFMKCGPTERGLSSIFEVEVDTIVLTLDFDAQKSGNIDTIASGGADYNTLQDNKVLFSTEVDRFVMK
jgi:hypothetical protein